VGALVRTVRDAFTRWKSVRSHPVPGPSSSHSLPEEVGSTLTIPYQSAMSALRHHAVGLALVEVSGPFLSLRCYCASSRRGSTPATPGTAHSPRMRTASGGRTRPCLGPIR
jgi:hypothetical protein